MNTINLCRIEINKTKILFLSFILLSCLVLANCGGGGSDSDSGNVSLPTYKVSGIISGLNGRIVLQNNGIDDLTISTDGFFSFSSSVIQGNNYDVTVSVQPLTQNCVINNSTGIIDNSNIITIDVSCTTLAINLSNIPDSGSIILQKGSPILLIPTTTGLSKAPVFTVTSLNPAIVKVDSLSGGRFQLVFSTQGATNVIVTDTENNLTEYIFVKTIESNISIGYINTNNSIHSCAISKDSYFIHCAGNNIDNDPVLLSAKEVFAISDGRLNTCYIFKDVSGNNVVGCTTSDAFGIQTGRPALSNPLTISVGLFHACAIDDLGVVCWGNNGSGQTTVPDLVNPVDVKAGSSHTCALDDLGVVCWGGNTGLTTVPALSNPVSISVNENYSCALDDSGVVCWGANIFGETTVPNLLNPIAVDTGFYHACALDDTGVVCWGDNSKGQISIPNLTNPVAITVGGYGACAVDDTGPVCWGEVPIPTVNKPKEVFTGSISHGSCVFDGTIPNSTSVICWNNRYVGYQILPQLSNPKSMSIGYIHSCALDSTGVQYFKFNHNCANSR